MSERDYRGCSWWLESCEDDLTPRPALDGSIDVDVAIMGAGFTGLWTAWHLLQREPGLEIAVIEKEIAGFGASGRNGGWCYAGFAVGPDAMTQRFGREAARSVALAMIGAVNNVKDVCENENIDADMAHSGAIEFARAPYQVPKIRGMAEEYAAIGLEDRVPLLDAAQAAEHLRVHGAIEAVWTKDGLTVQPAKLARGLARAVERRGATIYEQTAVLDYHGGERPRLVTSRGEVRARRAIVLAGEAYLSQLDKTRRHVIPITSNIVLTERLPASFWEEVGWEGRATVGGFGPTGAYIQRTKDDRIAFGPYRGRYPWLSRISDAFERDEATFAHARRAAAVWVPGLQAYQFTRSWGGVLGSPRDHLPTMGFNPRTKVGMAFGYTGEGVAAANLSGQVLGDLITGRDTELTHLPMATHQPQPWEPEPLRWAGVTYVRKSHYRLDEEAERTGAYPERKTLAQRLYDR
ncbi:MAG: NAD(P)/FAD-dependent oxidoreductase [Chloroflexota bacterium]